MPPQAKPLAERFWRYVDKPADTTMCWQWLGAPTGNGYGQIGSGPPRYTMLRAHRVSYELVNGPIDSSVVLLHECDNRMCVNPEHLRPGSHADNVADMRAKGREARGEKTSNPGERNGNVKLTLDDVVRIRALYATGRTQVSIAKEFGVHQPQISRIVLGKSWVAEDTRMRKEAA